MVKLSSVLLVDDDPTTNFLNKLLLQTQGVAEQVLVAENGQAALRLLAPDQPTCTPALILLDMNMPVMNGLAFLEAYAQLPLAQQQAIVVILLTTSIHERDLARAQQSPIAGFLDKPLNKTKLSALLHQYFPHTRTAEGAA